MQLTGLNVQGGSCPTLEECCIAKSKTLKITIASYLIKARETIKKRRREKKKKKNKRQRATLAEKLNL
jgi:hypothetical protein